jgi:tRNA (cytidine/uridine-2'-O-)-methyltransferase
MEIVLCQPEIPPNTGNIARLCAGLGLRLNLIEPLGFQLDDRHLRRAGLDYWPLVDLKIWPDWPVFRAAWPGGRRWGTSARTGALYTTVNFSAADGLVFGPETRGLPPEIKSQLDGLLNIPLRPGVRSLNLATAVGLVTGEALRQTGQYSALP